MLQKGNEKATSNVFIKKFKHDLSSPTVLFSLLFPYFQEAGEVSDTVNRFVLQTRSFLGIALWET